LIYGILTEIGISSWTKASSLLSLGSYWSRKSIGFSTIWYC